MLYAQKCFKLDDNIKRKITFVDRLIYIMLFFLAQDYFYYQVFILLPYSLWQFGYTYLIGVPVYSWIVSVILVFFCLIFLSNDHCPLEIIYCSSYLLFKISVTKGQSSICCFGIEWVNWENNRNSLPNQSSRGRKRHVWSHTVHLAVLLKKTTFLEIVPTYIKDCGFCCFQITFTF